jgi:hypothetical protein
MDSWQPRVRGRLEVTFKRVDVNQKQVVAALRHEGMTVQHLHAVGKGCPDLLVGWKGKNVLLEIKDGIKSWKLTPDQIIWHHNWQGQVAVATSPESAVQEVKDAIK